MNEGFLANMGTDIDAVVAAASNRAFNTG